MNRPNADSRLIAACLRCMALGVKNNDLDYLRAWLKQAEFWLRTGGSLDQRKAVEMYRDKIGDLTNSEAI